MGCILARLYQRSTRLFAVSFLFVFRHTTAQSVGLYRRKRVLQPAGGPMIGCDASLHSSVESTFTDQSPPACRLHRVSVASSNWRQRPAPDLSGPSHRDRVGFLWGGQRRIARRRPVVPDSRAGRRSVVAVGLVAVERWSPGRDLHSHRCRPRPSPRRRDDRRYRSRWPDGGVTDFGSFRLGGISRTPSQCRSSAWRRPGHAWRGADPAVAGRTSSLAQLSRDSCVHFLSVLQPSAYDTRASSP